MDRSRASARETRRSPRLPWRMGAARRWWSGIPVEAGTLGLLLLIASFGLLLGSLFPISARAPVTLGWVFTPIGATVGLALLARGTRTARWWLHSGVVFVVAVDCLLIAHAHTNGGLMMTAYVLTWAAVYVAVFFEWTRGEPLEACIARADARLYEAKRSRPGRRAARPTP